MLQTQQKKPVNRSIKENEVSRYVVNVVNKFNLLTHEEELNLARKACAGDKKAKDLLINSNLRFVVLQANKYKGYTKNGKISLMDLIQEGNLGLVRAAESFNPESGYKFITYAVHWINAKIMQFISSHHSLVKLASTKYSRASFWRMGEITEMNLERNPAKRQKMRQALIERIDCTEEQLNELSSRFAWHDYALSAPTLFDDGYIPNDDLLATESHEEAVENKDIRTIEKDLINKIIDTMKPREKEIITRRFLIDEPDTLKSIGEDFGVSRERIRQIEARLLEKIKDFLEHDKEAKEIVSFYKN